MNEQGIAWMIAGGTHDDSPEERRQRAQRRALAASQPERSGLRERLAGLITGRASRSAAAVSSDCCPA